MTKTDFLDWLQDIAAGLAIASCILAGLMLAMGIAWEVPV